MGHEHHERVVEIAERVRRYLERSPVAADTREGIATWWLRLPNSAETHDVVERALRLLEQEGFVAVESSAHGESVYRRARTNQEPSHDG